MSVQRYELQDPRRAAVMVPDGEGPWMRHKAHAATVAALEERVAVITRERDGFQALLGDAREALEAVRDMGAIDEPAHDRAVMGLVESDPRELLASVAIHSEKGGRR